MQGHTRHSKWRRTNGVRVVLLASLFLNASCTYLKYATIQADYARLQTVEPSQQNLKHMIERDTFAVIGHTLDKHKRYGRDQTTNAIAAFSSQYREHELVDVMHDIGAGTHFGLNLPPGEYTIVVFSDLDKNGFYESEEVIGRSKLTLSKQRYPSMVVTRQVIELDKAESIDWRPRIEAVRSNSGNQSLFFPVGTIRALHDPIFSSEMATLGLYDPAAFFEQVPTMFYALEENLDYKVTVVFVHGIGGSARDFAPLIEKLDRSRFKPWFYYYPSGGDLNHMAELFHSIFLSGETIPINELVPIVIVAHSMGGLVVREALNLIEEDDSQPSKIEFISLATPFGGHPSVPNADDAGPLILPSWRDIHPDSPFIRNLYRKSLPGNVKHQLYYAFDNEDLVKLGENSDGVVPLSSQLHVAAQKQSHRQLGLDVSHTAILTDPVATAAVIETISEMKSVFPENHMDYFLRGGYEVNVGEVFSSLAQYFLRHYGRYLEALSEGQLEPLSDWERELVPMLRGQTRPVSDPAKAWRKFILHR